MKWQVNSLGDCHGVNDLGGGGKQKHIPLQLNRYGFYGGTGRVFGTVGAVVRAD